MDELCRIHRNEEAHARHVAALAVQLFDAVRASFNLRRRDRLMLETAARLHDIGYADRPDDHVSAGIELVRRAGLRGFTEAQVDEITAIMALHGRLPDANLTGPLLEHAPRPDRVFQLGAILRVADALDHSHMQDSGILHVATADGMIRLRVSAPKDSGNPERAMAKSDLWQRVFSLGLVVEPMRRGFAGRPRASDPARVAIRRLLLAQYHVLRTAIRRAARDDDEEALHDLRIAVRCMRRLIEAFAQPLRKTSAAACGEQLRGLAKHLGPARDLDVWVSLLDRPRYSVALAGASDFLAAQREIQRAARAALRAELDSETTRALLNRLGFLLRIELADAKQKSGRSFGPIARREVRAAWKSLLEKRKWATSRKPTALHALRIRIRKLRVLAVLVSPALGMEREWFIGALHELERNLGRIHDLDEALVRASKSQAPPALVSALSRRRRKETRRFRQTWEKFDQPAQRDRCKAVFRKTNAARS